MSAASTPNPHPRKALFSSASDDWPTPQRFYDELDGEFGFVVDACASTTNHKAPHFYALDHPDPARRDGLAGDWAADARRHGGRAFCNPPYGRQIGAWMAKAAATARQGVTVVCLVPARTDTKWFHDHVLAEGAEVRFVRGRLKFGTATTSAPFSSLVVVYRGQHPTEAPTTSTTTATTSTTTATTSTSRTTATLVLAGGDTAAAGPIAPRPTPCRPCEAQTAHPSQTAGVRAGDVHLLRSPHRHHRGGGSAVVAAAAAAGQVPARALQPLGGCERAASDEPAPAGTVARATALILPLPTVRPVTTSTTGLRPAARTTKTCPDPATTVHARRAPASADPAASPATNRETAAVTPAQRLLALGASYTDARDAAGSTAARSDASIIGRHLYWLQTGRLPVKRGRAFDYSDVDTPKPGWVPIDPHTTTLDHWERYEVALMEAGIKASTRAKETTIIRGFYDWLRGPGGNPLPRKRKPNGEKNEEAADCVRGSTRAEVLSFYSTTEAQALLAAADAAVEDAAAAAGAGLRGGCARRSSAPAPG